MEDLHLYNIKSDFFVKIFTFFLSLFGRERMSFLSFHWLNGVMLLILENSPLIIIFMAAGILLSSQERNFTQPPVL
jgi:hypothetical protein